MSQFYREITGINGEPTTNETMRNICKRPGKVDMDGKIVYLTEQHHKDACDVNKIIRKYDKNGLITHVSRFEAQYGDVTGADFQTFQNIIAGATSKFNELPSEIRKKFRNSPQALLAFMDDPANREEAIKLGLIRNDWTDDTDGLGEHVKLEENITKEPQPNGSET